MFFNSLAYHAFMFSESRLTSSTLSGESIHYAISDKYREDYDLLLGMNDSLEFLRTVPSGSVKLIVTSPPYNIGKVYEERVKLDEYLDYQGKVARECVRILRDDGNLAWEVGNYVYNREIFPLDYFFYRIFKEDNKLKMRNRIIWHIGHGLHASLRFSGRYETISWYTKSDDYTFNLDPVRIPQKYPGKTYYKGKDYGKPSGNPLGKNPEDVWEVVLQDWEEQIWDIPNVKSNHPEYTGHPAQFPIELVQRLVLALTNEGDTVLDPFGGVGSSALASLLLKRKAISVERDEGYVKTTLDRIKAMVDGTLKIRKLGTKIYTPTGREKVSKFPESWINHDGE